MPSCGLLSPNVDQSANSLASEVHTSLARSVLHRQMIDVPASIPHSIHVASLSHDFFHSASEGSSTSTVYGPKLTPNNSEEVMVLDKFKKQIFSSLQPNDLSVFIRRVREAGLVHQQVKDDLDIMHPGVPHETKYRYLMVHICLEIKCSARKDRINSLNELCEVLYSFNTLAHIGRLINNEIVGIIKRRNEAGDNANDDHILISESHLVDLLYILSKHSKLWRHIGISLQVPPKYLDQIESDYEDNNVRFDKLLHAWLSRQLEHAVLPTLSNLRGALAVNLGREFYRLNKVLINTLSDKESDYDETLFDQGESTKIVKCFVSSDVYLEEPCLENTIIVEVKVKTHKPATITYQWFKNDLLEYSETLSMLCIHVRDITAEGEYSCSYRHPLCTSAIKSDPITVHVETLLDKYKSYFTARYCAKPDVMPDTWPHVSQSTYINLAVVDDSDTRISEEYSRQTIRGDADDVFGCKSNASYQEAFSNISYGDRVLVVGRPGSGKTTLVHRVSQDWGRLLTIRGVRSLFLISLRNFHSNPCIGLKELVRCYFDNEEDASTICEYIEKHQGLGVCFILDGLDEYQPQVEETYIDKLIKVHSLPRAIIIVASRPAAVAKYRLNTNKCIEVLGFFKKQVQEYIDSYKFKCQNKRSALKQYLIHHPNVHHMCYLPIQTAMICFLYDVAGDALPNTETNIYCEFTKHTILRALYRGKSQVKLQTLNCLQGTARDNFFVICKLAFEKTKISEQVLEKGEIEGIYTEGRIEESLGLITIDLKAAISGFQNTYSFCHLTFQEFLAAYHISKLEVQEQLAIIQSCGPMKHMYMVFKFYCGLVKFEEDCGSFKKLLEVAEFDTLHKLHCCFESQQPATCDFVADNGMIAVDGSCRTPSDYTCLGYVVMNAKKNTVRMMEFEVMYSLNEECVEAFIKATNGTRRTASPVELLSFKGNECLEQVLELVRACPSLLVVQWHNPEYMVIDCRSIGSHPSLEIVLIGFTDQLITSGFKEEVMKDFKQMFPNVRYIGVWGDIPSAMQNCSNPPLCPFSSVYCMPISSFSNGDLQRAEVLSISYEMISTHLCIHDDDEDHEECLCTHLYIFNCNINNPTTVLLTEGFKYNIRLKVLKLVANSIGDEGAVAIADSIKCCSSLHWLDLSLNRIGDEGAEALVSSLDSGSNFKLHLFGNCISDSIIARVCSKNNRELLQTLDISNCIGDVGLACIDSLMKEWTSPLSTVKTLHTLYLQSCNNSPDGIKCVANILSRFTSLQSVSLIDMNICDEGVRILSDSLQWRCISVLILSHNKIGDDGARAIAHALRGCEVLSVLDLSGNGIQDTGTEALGEALRSCKLQRLSLASNCMGPSGALAVAGVLKHVYKSLDTLDLSCNRLSDVGAVCLAGGLKHCSCLKQLHLNHNLVGDYGAMALARCLQTCNQLTTLNLSDNKIGDSGALCLGDYLKDCSLHTLRLNDNLISGCGAVGVAEGVKHCRCLHTLEFGWNFLFLKDINTMVRTLKDCVNLRRLVVAKHDNIGDEMFVDAEFLPISDYMPQCDIIVDINEDKSDTDNVEINYGDFSKNYLLILYYLSLVQSLFVGAE